MRTIFVLLVIQDVLSLLLGPNSAATAPTNTSLIDFCQEAQQYFAKQATLTPDGWNRSLPTAKERVQMRALLTYLYKLPTFSGRTFPLTDYPALVPWINISIVQDYLIVHEQFPPPGSLFPRNWGLVALCEPTACSRTLHHSAVHFDSEGPIYQEAVWVGQKSHSRSVALHGASRYALRSPLNSSCQPAYTATDGAHNADTMFQLWSATLFDLSRSRLEDYTFVQWHGMAETSCVGSDAFASSGTKNPTAYGNDSIAVRVRDTFNSIARPLTCLLPPEEPDCNLVATDNPLGRLINGVEASKVCTKRANDTNVTGRFLHIEQKKNARLALDAWTRTFELVFPATG